MFPRRLLDSTVHCLTAASLALVLLSACAGAPSMTGAQFATRDGRQPLQRIYRLGVGDKLKITVFGEENLSGQFEVGALGNISVPLIGEVPAKGQTIGDFRNQITRRLSDGYLKNPKVNVDILNYRPIYVHGEVKNGGEFAYRNGLSLRDAVAMAGGYTYRADQSYLYIGRDGEPDAAITMPTDVPVLPGDNIRIPERFF
jgi:protein involved in polysaccharide export with SLBB domain